MHHQIKNSIIKLPHNYYAPNNYLIYLKQIQMNSSHHQYYLNNIQQYLKQLYLQYLLVIILKMNLFIPLLSNILLNE